MQLSVAIPKNGCKVMGVFADSGKTRFIAKGCFYFVFVFQHVRMECCCGCFNVYKIFPSVIVSFLPKEKLKKNPLMS